MATLDQIKQIKAKIPVLNAQARKRIEGGRAMQLQQAVQQAPTTPTMGIRAAQQIAPALQTQAGEQQIAAGAAEQQQLGHLAEQALQQSGMEQQRQIQEQAVAQREDLTGQQRAQELALSREQEAQRTALTQEEIDSMSRVQSLGMTVDNELSFLSRKQREDLAALGADVKGKIFDNILQFETDELGRKFTNKKQLLDFAVSSAVSEQELQTKLNTMQNIANREIIILEQSYKQITQALDNNYLDDKRELDQAQRQRLIEMKMAMEKKIAKKKREASMERMVVGALITGAGVAMAASGVGTAAAPAVMAAGVSYGTSGQGS